MSIRTLIINPSNLTFDCASNYKLINNLISIIFCNVYFDRPIRGAKNINLRII